MDYKKALKEIKESGIEQGAGDFVDMEAMKAAADALEKMEEYEQLKATVQEQQAHWQEVRKLEIDRVVVLAIELLKVHGLTIGLKKWEEDGAENAAIVITDTVTGEDYMIAEKRAAEPEQEDVEVHDEQ